MADARASGEGYSVNAVPFDQVDLDDEFWLPRLRTQARELVPYSFQRTSEALTDLQAAARLLAGEPLKTPPPPHRYRTSDLFKVMEGAAYLLAIRRDPDLQAQMDQISATIAAAQEPDGYLNATRTLYPNRKIDMMGDGRYKYIDHSHELYIVGHLYEAAVAYYRATGKRTLLDVADKNAKHVRRVFFEGDPRYNGGNPINQAPGHEEIELALVRLSEATGNAIHLDTARRFLDIRGVTYRPNGAGVNTPTYAQQHLPVVKQAEPTGHAVRATYLYAGMADVGAKLGDHRYSTALDAIWRNIVDTRMHITGGLGAVHGIEGFGGEYDLPNHDAFNETCAAVGNVMFNWRMFLLHHDAIYVDVAEVALYNNALAGMNLDGNRFFYVNPLATDGYRPFNHGSTGRAPWFGTACCPTNLARLVPQVPGMLFAQDDQGVMACLYAGCKTRLTIDDQQVVLTETTDYPYGGTVRIKVDPQSPVRFTLRLRVPAWAGDRFVPGGLYHYIEKQPPSPVKLFVNNQAVELNVDKGFAIVDREWSAADEVRLELPMPVRRSRCVAQVQANRHRVAITRGPLVYCAESVDNAGHVSTYFVGGDQSIDAKVAREEIKGHRIDAITVKATRLLPTSVAQAAPLKLVPYYAWNNRGPGSMAVWLPDNERTMTDSTVVIDDNAQRFLSAKATHTYSGDRVQAMIDGRLPKHSFDTSIPRWTSWPKRGEPQEVEFTLAEATVPRSIDLYWYDDHGGVQTPVRWDLQYQKGNAWVDFPLYNTDSYGVRPDQFNVVHPASPIKMKRVKLRVWPKDDAAAGVLEFIVRPETSTPDG